MTYLLVAIAVALYAMLWRERAHSAALIREIVTMRLTGNFAPAAPKPAPEAVAKAKQREVDESPLFTGTVEQLMRDKPIIELQSP